MFLQFKSTSLFFGAIEIPLFLVFLWRHILFMCSKQNEVASDFLKTSLAVAWRIREIDQVTVVVVKARGNYGLEERDDSGSSLHEYDFKFLEEREREGTPK
jgi:hypothetical protein